MSGLNVKVGSPKHGKKSLEFTWKGNKTMAIMTTIPSFITEKYFRGPNVGINFEKNYFSFKTLHLDFTII